MSAIHKRVLIVDDEEDLTWTLVKKLSKDSDKFELYCVNSGKEAFDVLNQLPVDLVITDVRMPEVSGLDLLTAIKQKYPSTKVVIMTAYGSADVQKEATERGCFNYIEKPFEINELRQLILDSIADQRGFTGNISDFQLSDIIQLNCLGRLNSALSVKTEGDEGIIYFREGEIIHAETKQLEGQSAFFSMMSWQGGEFSVLRNKTAPRETISLGWQSLLLEGMRRADEHSSLAREDRENEKQYRIFRIQQLLTKIEQIEHVKHTILFQSAGFPITYVGEFQQKPEKITEIGNSISEIIETVCEKSLFMDGGLPLFWELHFKTNSLLLQRVPDADAYLAVIGSRKLNSAMIRLQFKKVLPQLAEHI